MELLLVLLIALAIIFLPTIIAFNRGHHNRWPIFWLNFFLGLTLIGWVVALVWALSRPPEVRVIEVTRPGD